jgi:Leucine-rich repeat (LRR) protein
MRLGLRLLSALTFLWLGNGCLYDAFPIDEPDRMAGGGGLETVGVRGSAAYENGTPVVGARVILRPKEFLADTAGPLKKVSIVLAETETDAKGGYAIDSVETGDYLIEVNDQRTQAAVMPANVSRLIDGVIHRVAPATLKSVGTLTGRVLAGSLPIGDAYVQIFGMERVVKTDALGRFAFDNLPEGFFEVVVLRPRPYGYMASYALGWVQIRSARNTELGDVEFPSGCQDYVCDSLVVQYILHKTGNSTTPVESVTFLAAGRKRISELDLSARGISFLPKEIQDLNQLYRLELDKNNLDAMPVEVTGITSLGYLSLNYNRLRTLPNEIGNLKSLIWLHLYGNSIDSLPGAIGGLVSLRYFVLDYNNLQSLPPQIGFMTNVSQLFLSNNRIASLPDAITYLPKVSVVAFQGNRLCYATRAIQDWLDVRASPWRQSQVCGHP